MGIITDPIADMLVRIKNANQRKHKDVAMPHSKVKENIAVILKSEGFISGFSVAGEGKDKKITIALKYKGAQRAITGVKRISKPGLRVYAGAEDLPKVLSGFGTAIISTSNGIITDREARKANVGGEVLAYVW
ncbi:30S ribosomal protein S8 [Mycoplasma todarodis]|uniref:Small ribosomal subunit protein uS8 n=1 Tax=Mycoplasma todarodis TaxID=1937191 RepID=A0A4R0XN09_9MOLU|nr:30S ribosomal protein S8 [Mycoplasma todarodis]NQZ29024.1 30S ribosomal protein S8 [Mycoplasmatales bacterium]TCG10862.1 30S ribosomal protein S8 [Mycoplasma todarodis]